MHLHGAHFVSQQKYKITRFNLQFVSQLSMYFRTQFLKYTTIRLVIPLYI